MAGRRPPRHVRVFLSSPGDVVEERRAARAALQQIGRSPLVREDFTIEVVSWDDPDAPVPMLATLTPQRSVTQALPRPSECDVTVVILAGRMGTPLEELRTDGQPFRSGTEWEFEDARSAGRPILLYRCLEPRPRPSDDQHEVLVQRQRVEEFFGRFAAPGGALLAGVTTYRTSEEFARRIHTDFETLLRQLRTTGTATDQEQSFNAGWLGRAQRGVSRWHYGRLLMVNGSGGVVSLIAWAAYGAFTEVSQDHGAPLLAYGIRYLLLAVGLLVPLVLVVMTWWWLVPNRTRLPS